jgi:hypothetical protein
MLTREESLRAIPAKPAVVMLAALLATSLAIFSFGMHPARATSGCNGPWGPGKGRSSHTPTGRQSASPSGSRTRG